MSSAPFSIKARISSFRHASVALGVVLLVFSIALVVSLEAINAAIEKIGDMLSSEFHPLVKRSKDLAAAAVFVAAVAPSITGIIIFLPKILALC